MNIDVSKSGTWLARITAALPELDKVIAESESPILLIGAVVFDFYADQNWIPPLKRKTGDLDLSVGLVNGHEDYERIRGR
jgi:hypothetical protein